MAVQRGKAEAIENLWEWAKEILNTDELNNKLLLAMDNDEMTAFHHASFSGILRILERIRNLANEQTKTEEF